MSYIHQLPNYTRLDDLIAVLIKIRDENEANYRVMVQTGEEEQPRDLYQITVQPWTAYGVIIHLYDE